MPKDKYFLTRPDKKGLYDPDFERDSCGVGLVANIKGLPSREIMDNAYLINSRMDHRGGCGFEENTGDGAGILLALPDSFFNRKLNLWISTYLKKENMLLEIYFCLKNPMNIIL